jgi:hypothetical protein
VNPTSLTIVAGLSAAMLVIFVATGQQLNLTVTAVLVTGGIATLAVFFYAREEAREEANEGDSTDEPPETPAIAPSAEPPTPVQPEDTPTIDSD